jgi:hypothetical protein
MICHAFRLPGPIFPSHRSIGPELMGPELIDLELIGPELVSNSGSA